MAMARFPIIDPHIHLWDPRTNPRAASPFVKLFGWNRKLLHTMPRLLLPKAVGAFVGKPDFLVAPYLPPDYAGDHGAHEVEGYVYIEASWTGRGKLAQADEVRWVQQVADNYDGAGPSLLGVVGAADLRRDDLGTLLRAHREASGRLVGIRDKLAWSPDRGVMDFAPEPQMMSNPDWRRGFAMLAEHDLVFDAWVYDHQLNALHDVLAAHPEVNVVLDHLGTPVGAGGPFATSAPDEAAQATIRERWRESISRLADHPQLSLKLSGMFMPVVGWGVHERETPVTVEQVRDALAPFFEHAISCFGPSRCMLASNFPMDKVSVSFETLYEAHWALVADRPEQEQRALLRDNAKRIYGLR